MRISGVARYVIRERRQGMAKGGEVMLEKYLLDSM